MPTPTILLTGATGFVGQQILQQLPTQARVFGRTKPVPDCFFFAGELSENTDYFRALSGVDVVIHCAARAHVMNEAANRAVQLYQKVNADATFALAKQAAAAGVKRFIFISSIKVNGELTSDGSPFRFNDDCKPKDPYGLSKCAAEIALKKLAVETGMEVVIIRPTLVYGPGVKANFASLMNLVAKGLPLPFGCITENKRSLVSVHNLVDLIITCIDHPKAANNVFLVSDDHDVSTSEMVREMSRALGKPTWQLPIPIWCYKIIAKLFKKSEVVGRLIGSLEVDISHTKETLGWKPPLTLQEGFKQTAQAFLQKTK